MSDNTTTTVANTAPEKPTPPAVTLRPLVRNETSIQPVFAQIERGVGEGVFYPVVLPTEENFDDFVKYLGKKNIIEKLAAKQKQDAQAALDYILTKKGMWKETYQQKIVEVVEADGSKRSVPQTVFVKDKDNKEVPKIASMFYKYEDFSTIVDELLEALEKGSIRGGVTIKSLREENAELMKEMHTCLANAAKDPSVLVRATEISAQIQSNESEIARISEARKSALSSGESDEEKAA